MHLHPTIASTTLFPGLGYFGTTSSDCIDISWNGHVRGVRITIPADGKTNVLNLTKLELHGPGGVLSWDEQDIELSQSSMYNADPRFGPAQLLQGRSIHSQPESQPWWQVLFTHDKELTRLRLYNRGDRWGIRARHLVIELLVGDHWMTLRDPRGAQHVLGILQDCMAIAAPVCSDGTMSDLRRNLLKQISDKLLSNQLHPSTVPWGSVLNLVDIWGNSSPDEQEMTLLAAWMTQASGLYPLLPLADRLKTPASILALQAGIQTIAASLGIGHFVITRHGIQRSYLLSHRDAFLDGAEKLMACLQGLGYEPMVSYGTLLGAVRDGSLIAHDDDLDLLMLCRATDQEAVAAEMTQVAAQLRTAGYQVEQLLPQSLNMHIRDNKLGIELDLFPCWRVEGGRVNLHMEKMVVRSIADHLVIPPSKVHLHGRELPAPADPHGFLLERYGADWTIPNQFFEWPWPLSSTH